MKRFFLFVIYFALFFSAKAQDKHGTTAPLNGTWNFRTDPDNVGESLGWPNLKQVKNAWDSVSVPGNWDTKNEYSHYAGKAWYQRNVVIPKSWANKRIYLSFEGVYFECKVWFNGRLMGSNDNGFLPFQYDVSGIINRNAGNSIVVSADNTFRLGATWNWGGIRRPVKLIAYDDVHIVSQRITPAVDLNIGMAKVSVQVLIVNDGEQRKQVEGSVEIGAQNIVIRPTLFKTDVAPHATQAVTVNFVIEKSKVHLWHFDDPFLYNSIVRIVENGQPADQLDDRFGLRKIEVDNKNYSFKLNGESVRLMGFNLVPDDRTTGNTLPLWRIKADVDDMKALGCNMARLTHFPLPKAMYDYLDERGILVFPEVSLWGAEPKVDPDNTIPKDWLKRTINDNYNHPCIIGWSVGNEIGHNPLALKYVKQATAMSRSLDPTRLAVVVSHTADRPSDIIDDSDMGLVNKYSSNLGPLTRKMHAMHPEKLLFYSEYGNAQTSDDLDGDINAKALLDSIRFKPYLMGASLWTYNDYRSNYLATKGYTESRPWGVVDDFRQRKKSWYSFRREYCPLKSIKVESIKVLNEKAAADLSLLPRKKLDLPAYVLKNYRVTCQVKDGEGNILSAAFINLPQINPGEDVIKKLISWNQPSNAALVQIELVSPLNYAVSDTTIYFSKPQPPKILYYTGARTLLNDFKEKTASIRVIFQKSFLAQGYKVRYGKDKLASETPVTVNNYIDINGLDFDQTYNLSLVAVNETGESEPVLLRNIATSYIPAPPIIKYTEAADKGVFIGYETVDNDYMFNVRSSTVSGNYTNAATIHSTNKGVLFIPNLVNGQTYYIQIQRLKQNSYPSPWSAEIAVQPDGGILPGTPAISGVLQIGNQALILFNPDKKATGYLLKYHLFSDKNWKETEIGSAQINQYLVTGLNPGRSYEFKLATINANGISEFSAVKRSF